MRDSTSTPGTDTGHPRATDRIAVSPRRSASVMQMRGECPGTAAMPAARHTGSADSRIIPSPVSAAASAAAANMVASMESFLTHTNLRRGKASARPRMDAMRSVSMSP